MVGRLSSPTCLIFLNVYTIIEVVILMEVELYDITTSNKRYMVFSLKWKSQSMNED